MNIIINPFTVGRTLKTPHLINEADLLTVYASISPVDTTNFTQLNFTNLRAEVG